MLYNVIPNIKKVKITNFFCIDLFSFYTGIVMTSLAYFVAYCIIKRNKPVINNQIVQNVNKIYKNKKMIN